MDAKDHPVITVLGDQKRFMVPIYQRQYSWTTKHWSAFWDDVVAKAEEATEGKPKFKHYMGALIIAPGADGYTVGTTPRVQVVDGQQRLTTFQIFLVALREVANKLEFPEVSESVANYIFNRPMTGDLDADAKFKLVPTPEDRAVFHDLMEGGLKAAKSKHAYAFYQNGNLKVGSAPNSIKALIEFILKVEDYVKHGVYDLDDGLPSVDERPVQQKRFHALLEALLNHLKLVVITLDESDDAQVIFETLNSKAEPLLAMDLVRNNIFHRAEAQGESAQKLFETKWRPLDAPFWKADSPRAKPRRPRIDHFLSHALTAQTGKEVSVRELYAEYRAFARPKGQPRFAKVEQELDALVRFTSTYQSLEEGENENSLGQIGAKLAVWEVTTAYPLIFCIDASDTPETDKAALYQLIYSYIVRRAVSGLTAKNLNKNFQRLVAIFLEKGVSIQSFKNAFNDQSGPAVRFPSNADFEEAIETNPIYQWILKRERLADILWELELKSRNKFSVGTPRPIGMSIEHVLPQTWKTHWPLRDGTRIAADATVFDDDVKAAMEVRQSSLHTLGNLTLITVPGNSAASNAPFSEKRTWLKQSLLALNLDILENENWNEDQIAARGSSLAAAAVQIWPGLEDIE